MGSRIVDNTYRFYTNSVQVEEVELKGEKEYYITGYISTDEMDAVKDIVTEECMVDMAEQIKEGNIRCDIEHEVFTNSPNANPIARFVDARVEKSSDGTKLWGKALLNSAHSRFQEIWKSIQNKFIDAFSIAYRPLKFTYQQVDGTKARILDKLKLLNVALTAMPVNSGATFSEVMVKSLADVEGKMDNAMQNKESVSNVTQSNSMQNNETSAYAMKNENCYKNELCEEDKAYYKSWASDNGEEPDSFLKMAEEEPHKALKAVMKKNKEGKKSMESEKKPEAESSQAEVKSLAVEIKSMVEENKRLSKECAELKSQIAQINDVLAKPVLKSILEGVSAGMNPVEQKAQEAKRSYSPLDLV